ncbi:MAG: UDP-3-O-acyl-N-acetylglucosamine deacetylase [Treponema sp.]|nr:UDP-3-O-acyl-N-acetylglucosamine deacetylase [Treponema sp.]
MKQKTLKKAFTVKGKGLHTGQMSTATFMPADVNTGYVFKRIDLEGQPTIQALAEHVIETTRGTVIASKSNKEARVSTIEHAMAALYAAGIDNCLIEVDCGEVPILDGSAIIWCQEIEKAGICSGRPPPWSKG